MGTDDRCGFSGVFGSSLTFTGRGNSKRLLISSFESTVVFGDPAGLGMRLLDGDPENGIVVVVDVVNFSKREEMKVQ